MVAPLPKFSCFLNFEPCFWWYLKKLWCINRVKIFPFWVTRNPLWCVKGIFVAYLIYIFYNQNSPPPKQQNKIWYFELEYENSLLFDIFFLDSSNSHDSEYFNITIATLGPSEKFSLTEDLASLSLQDGPQSGNIITEPPSQPPSHPDSHPDSHHPNAYI